MFRQTVQLSAIAIFASLALSACDSSYDDIKIPTFPQLTTKGVWERVGYGELLEVTDSALTYYQFNQFGCTKLLETTEQIALDQLRLKITPNSLTKLAIQEQDLIEPYYLQRINTLPTSCTTSISVDSPVSQTYVFDYIWNLFNDYYAYFDTREVNWQTQYDTYRPLVNDSMNDEALFQVLSELVAPLQDAHVNIINESKALYFNRPKDNPFSRTVRGMMFASLRDGEVLDPSEIESELNQLYAQISTSYMTPSSAKRFPSDPQDEPTVLWGITPDNVGIITINNMMSYASDTMSEEATLAAANSLFDTIMTQLAQTKGIIVDVRNNQGGYDSVSLAIAQRFNQTDHAVFYKQAKTKTGTGDLLERKLNGRSDAYTNPVYLLTSEVTVSAGEIFVIAMRSLPQVTQVGKETSGALSDLKFFDIPNDWSITLSNEVYWTSDNQYFEKTGIPPAVSIPAFSVDDLKMGRFQTYDYALKALGRTSDKTLSEAEFEQKISQLSNQANIKNMSISVIKDNEIVYEKGFGMNARTGEATSPQSEFYLGSVSKTLLGATIAAALENQPEFLDTALQPVLPFVIDATQFAQDNPLTLRQLITHTSGILDSEQTYLCSYFTYENSQSLASLLAPEMGCPETVSQDEQLFFSQYLSAQGELHSHENFITQYGLKNNQAYVYSNIASALAGLVLEQKTGQSLSQLSTQLVFNPLGMTHTYWAVNESETSTPRYVFDDDSQSVYVPEYRNITYADGMAVSSSHDLARYLIALGNSGKINGAQALNPTVVTALLNPQTILPTPEGDIGYFWQLDGDIVSHDGSDPGVATNVLLNRREKFGYVLLSNADADNEQVAAAFQAINGLVRQFAEQQ
ncbi:serine hydrolase [Pseudoalteromonas xiamenensis]